MLGEGAEEVTQGFDSDGSLPETIVGADGPVEIILNDIAIVDPPERDLIDDHHTGKSHECGHLCATVQAGPHMLGQQAKRHGQAEYSDRQWPAGHS